MAQHTLDYKSKPQYNSYSKRAKEKYPNEICITKDEFTEISNSNCYYCNKSGPNGIDRKDNNYGYKLNNCVPACKHCNYVKGDLTLKDFNTWKNRFITYQTTQL